MFATKRHHSNEVEVLLITSRQTCRWVIPKGWSLARKKPHQVARQEAWEEAGVRGRVWKEPFGHYRYEKMVSPGEFVPCLVQVHLLTVSELEDDFPEKGQRQIRWFSPQDAAQVVREPELQQLLTGLSARSNQARVVRTDDAPENLAPARDTPLRSHGY